MRAPPVAVKQMKGSDSSQQTCTARTNLSPTTEPMEPPRKPNSNAAATTGGVTASYAMLGDIHIAEQGALIGFAGPRVIEQTIREKLPFICFTATGGARMQEGLLSLMQMAKTTAALHQLSACRQPFISILTDPTMGGVSASFAFIGDAVIAEPGALIGFAGPRVIEQTVRETLPEGFQRAEFLLEKGAIDIIVDRRHLRDELAHLLAQLTREPPPLA